MTGECTDSASSCRLCGTRDCPTVLQRPAFRIRRCPQCTTLWCDPLRLRKGPESAVPQEDTEDVQGIYHSVEPTIHRENAKRLARVQRFAPPETHPRLLEIGCMHGDFVDQARRAGYEALGRDISPRAVAWSLVHRPGMVELGTLDARQPSASMDVVAAFNVIEHLEHPGAFLEHAHRVLRPGGLLVAETPSQESIYHHVLFARGRLLSRRPRVDIGMHPGTHIFKFGKRAWSRILQARDFQLLEMRPKSTPLLELLAKTRGRGLLFAAGTVSLGIAARLTGLGNRVLFAARR